MYRKIHRLSTSNALTRILIVTGLVLTMFALTAAEASISETINYSAGFVNDFIPISNFSIDITITPEITGTITITGPEGYSNTINMTGPGASTDTITLGAPGTYTVNENYDLEITGTSLVLPDPITENYSATADPWTFEVVAAGSTGILDVTSSFGNLTVEDHSDNISVSISGMDATVTVGDDPINVGDSVSITAQGLWTVTTSMTVTEAPPETGNIEVTTNRADAVFDLTGPVNRTGSGTSESWTDIPTGEYTVTFHDIPNYNTPEPQMKTLTANETISFNGDYVISVQTGTVNVYTNNANATFDLTGADNRSGGGMYEVWTDMPVGAYTTTFHDLAGFNTPAPQAQTLIAGETITFNGIYSSTVETGMVEVITNNAAAAFDVTGPEIRTGNGMSKSWSDMPVGTYTVTFHDVAGFNTPAPQSDELTAGETITFHGEYTSDRITEGPYTVTRVIDGDTIKLDEFEDSVRYIGIDTPETVEPCGPEATEFNKGLVEGKEVMLEFDVERTDQYGRILAYVYLTDDTFVNAELVKQGYAVAYTVPPNVKYAEEFAELENEAREAKRGCLWAESTGTIEVHTNLKDGVTFTIASPGYTQADFTFEDFDTHRLWTLTEVPIGDHTITFGDVANYDAPAPLTLTLAKDKTITFAGEYARHTGTIRVRTTLKDEATFTVNSPDYTQADFTFEDFDAYRQWTMTEVPTGDYTITFGDVASYDTPASLTLTLAKDESIVFIGEYAPIPPAISGVVVAGSMAGLGSTIFVSASGDPGLTATFSIGDIVSDLPMAESATIPGLYAGEYIVREDDNAADAVVSVKLTNTTGTTTTNEDEQVVIDTTPPVIESVVVSGSPARYAGDVIKVTMAGEPGGMASFSIPGAAENVSMTESAEQPGTYEGSYIAVDGLGVDKAKVTVSLSDTVGNTSVDENQTASICTLLWDVNRDGIVDVLDIGLIGSNLGKTPTPEFDLNSDGVIDMLDLMMVAMHYGETCGFEEAMMAVARFAPHNIPSYLFQNYPNPCNPGTWIPFMLAEGQEVAVNIYSPNGRLIRRLDLGYKEPGVYVNKAHGAYWDGNNEFGEEVTSGVYFYHIQAGKFSAVRKMLVSK